MTFSPTNIPTCIRQPRVTPQSFIQGTDAPGGAGKTLFTAGPNGSKITGILVNTTENGTTHLLVMSITRSGVNYTLVYYTLPINVGGDGSTPSVDLLAGGPGNLLVGLPIDNDGQPYLFLESGDVLNLIYNTALSSTKAIYVTTIGGDF